MAPIKFDEDIREGMEQRQLSPSEGAWESLEKRLDDAQVQKKPKTKIWWVGAAAAVVLGALLSIGVLFKSVDKVETLPTVVEESIQNPVIESNINSSEDINKSVVLEGVVKNNEQGKVAIIEEPKTKEVKKSNPISVERKEEQEVRIANNEKQPDAVQEKEKSQIGLLESNQDAELVANETAIDEVEFLLAQARERVQKSDEVYLAQKEVNASSLLETVEGDIEESFRDKVFQAIEFGYKSVKTAVVERNK
ncbi:hypothetical protein [Mangrovimonas aestuarii]|uniref:hypothetical protein n=1 Tax=Mangrovimonas aestuarii TaxID=3018443 RepID=UPI00237979D2|nr:hypothetical protein [Mangrovimonas aestuarii]